MHIGLVGGIGPAATGFYYRRLVEAHASAGKVMELTIVHADVADLLRNLANGAAREQSDIFLGYLRRLQAAGAEAAAITALAGHFCIEELEAVSPLPIVNAIPEFDKYFTRQKLNRVGMMGTRAVMDSRLYGGISSVEIVLPQGDEFEATHANYVAVATSGRATDEQREYLFSAGKRLCQDQGAEAVVLAGTDFFLAFDGHDCGYPVIDSAQLHIEALVRASIGPH